ncbi:MAG: hypothetical protein QOC62_1961, partial [Mycobacterium sp.]|nr:hypothetical protein [Mycobacterium sp.]
MSYEWHATFRETRRNAWQADAPCLSASPSRAPAGAADQALGQLAKRAASSAIRLGRC